MKRSIAVVGGDRRQVHLARLLMEDGWPVTTWGLEKGDAPNAVPLQAALTAEMILLPLPVCREGKLNLPLTDTRLEPTELWSKLSYDQLLLGGMTGQLPKALLLHYGLTLLDYYQREEVQLANAVPTAEGAIQLAMEATDTTIHGSRCLVVGYGRIGKMLAHRLRALGAQVAVSARKYSDLALIQAFGYRPLWTEKLSGCLGDFDLIFNTVPSPVLDGPLLAQTKESCVLLELASAPGGIHRPAAEKLGRRLVEAPGLPGMVAPRTAAAAIRDSIYHILEERGELF